MTLKATERKTVATLNSPERATANPIRTVDGQARQFSNRRSTRVAIDFPVSVFGQDVDGKIFVEKTKTLIVSAHGALVALKTNVDPQKPALLENTKTGMEVQCRVVFRKEIAKGHLEVGLEFANPFPRFWGMNFPPDDWKSADRKKITYSHRPVSNSKKESNT
jgi:hypothetical protein